MSRAAFLLRKAHSLTGVLPVGVFLALHLWTNASALAGARAFNEEVDRIQALPLLPAIEIFGVLLPLAFHAGYGVWLSFFGAPNPHRYVHGRNWLYFLQRATGIVTLVFLLLHLWEFRVQKWLYGMHAHSLFGAASADLSSVKWGVPWIALGYTLGLSAAVFHFANGLAGFVMSWGIAGSRRAVRALSWAFGVFGVGLFGLGLVTVVYFATGQTLVPIHEVDTAAPCP